MSNIVKVAGCWEMGANVPLIEFYWWESPLREFGVTEFYMSPITGIDASVHEVAKLQEVIDTNPNLTIVWVDEKAETPLTEFKHPKNALYILGRTGYSPMSGMRNKKDLSVRIDSGSGGMYANQAIVIVLYDRWNKERGLKWR